MALVYTTNPSTGFSSDHLFGAGAWGGTAYSSTQWTNFAGANTVVATFTAGSNTANFAGQLLSIAATAGVSAGATLQLVPPRNLSWSNFDQQSNFNRALLEARTPGTTQAFFAGDDTFLGGNGGDILRAYGGRDLLDGDAGVDTLDGGTGADTLIGGLGNDFFVVDNAGDLVIERVGEGKDEVFASQSGYVLPTHVEVLRLLGSAVSGTGNAAANTLVGNGAGNLLSGLAGNDRLDGQAGADVLNGGLGIDTLMGGLGNDAFLFNAPLSSTHRDIVSDFANVSGNNDAIRLENGVMKKLGAVGKLNAAFFKAGTAAADADDHVIYNKATGVLSYDANGNVAGGVTVLATLTNKPTLTAADLFVI